MTGISFSFDPDWMYTLSAPFMTNAFLAGLCISLAAGVMGYFTIARHSTFAAHALAHIGLPGATGAVLLGLPVSLGMGVFALGGALVIGALGKRATQREIATGTVLAFATGLGLFFARLSSSASQQMQSILFGSILTITTDQILGFAVFDVILLAVLAIVYRPLLFSSVDEQVAQAKGVPIGLMNVAFMAIMAGVITIAVPAVGTLLIFALVITPAATANAIVAVQGDGDRDGSVPGVDLGRSGAVRDVPRSPELHHRHVVDAVLGDRQGRDVAASSLIPLDYITSALAMAAIPSPRPVNPIWSVVVAVTVTRHPTASDSARSASSRHRPIFGRLPMMTTLALDGILPCDRNTSTVLRNISQPCMPAPGASAPTPNSPPMSPSPAADNSASIRAWAATSPSESPSIPTPSHKSPASHSCRAGSSAKRCASNP